MTKTKRLGTLLLSLALAATVAFPASQFLAATAAAHEGTYGTVNTEEGGVIWKNQSKNSLVAVTIDLKEEKALPAEKDELYLAIKIGSTRNPAESDTLDIHTNLEDNKGGRYIVDINTNSTSPVWSVPVLNGDDTMGEALIRRGTEMMFRSPAGVACTIMNSILLIPFRYYVLDKAGQGLESVRYVTISSTAVNGRWQELRSFSIVTLEGLEPVAASNGNGYSTFRHTDGGAAATAAQVREAIGNELMLVDFTAFTTQAQLDAKLDSGDWTTQTVSGNNPTLARDITHTGSNTSFNEEMKSFLRVNETPTVTSVNLNASLKNALVLGLDEEAEKGNTNSDKTSDHYDTDNYTYLELWKKDSGSVDVTASAGFALKLRCLSAQQQCAFRLYLYSEDGTRYGFPSGVNNANRDKTDVFLKEDGTDVRIGNYYSCVWANAASGTGTLYFSYDRLIKIPSTVNAEPLGSGPARIQNVARIQIAFDYTDGGSFKNVLVRKMAIGMLADVKADGTISPFFNTAEMTYTEDPADATKDVNLANPMQGKTVHPYNKGNDAEVEASYNKDLAYKNEAWKFRRVTALDLLSRDSLKQSVIGDVKVLEDFSMPDGVDDLGLGDDEKNEVFNSFSVNVGYPSRSYATLYDNGEYGYGDAALWRIGDYSTEYHSGDDPFGKIAFQPAASSPLASLKQGDRNALGITIFVENKNETQFEFCIETILQHTAGDYSGKIERWSPWSGAKVFYYDMATGREFAMYMTTSASTTTLRVPKGFAGWLRIPFSEMGHPAWTGNDNRYAMVDYIDFDNDIISNITINSNMQNNSNKEAVLDNLGLYYGEFTVSSIFHSGKTTMKSLLENDSFFGA